MTHRSSSPRCCPECGSIAIVRLEDMDNCTRCGKKQKRMKPLHFGSSTPEQYGYAPMRTTVPGMIGSGVAYMKRKYKSDA